MMFSKSRFPGGWAITLCCVALLSLTPALVAQEVQIDVSGAAPGGMASATVTGVDDGSTIMSYSWEQVGGVAASLANTTSATVEVTLGGTGAYKSELFTLLAEPPIGVDQLPPNVPVPEGEFPGGLQDRFEVIGLNHFILEETGLVVLEVTVVTNTGTYVGEAEVHTELPWKPSTGLHNVPMGRTVLLHGKVQDSYDWVLAAPGGSAAALMDGAGQNPMFTPDVAGVYTVTVTDMTGEENAIVTLEVYSGSWQGAIAGQDADGNPVASASCTVCHNGGIAPANFDDWSQTGHSMIFSDNLDTSTHYGEGCFDCHTVGYDTDVANGGFDDAADFEDFLGAGLLNVPGDNWTTMLADYPAAAQLANIQCENCHGPQNSPGGHMTGDEGPRVDLSADVCARCHGEPLRHARFQQWQLSGHANFEVAIDEGGNGSCAKCHSANGFLAWLEDVEEGGDPEANPEVDWTTDEIQPQTCVTCHDPHMAGMASGVENDITVRIYGDTLPLASGITITDMGNGAICAQCHNSRRGLRNDSNYAESDTKSGGRSPHGGPQSDVLAGENAYLVTVGQRSPHANTALFENTCSTCHMVNTPPPDDLAYNQGGTNHTFYAGTDFCADCHSEGIFEELEEEVELKSLILASGISSGYMDAFASETGKGNSLDFDGVCTVNDAMMVSKAWPTESHGRQALEIEAEGCDFEEAIQVRNIDVVPMSGDPYSIQDVISDDLAKSFWNYLVVHNDSSMGAHNPDFVRDVLDTSIATIGAELEPCSPTATTACMIGDRFSVVANWVKPDGEAGSAKVSGLTLNEGEVFYFFNEENPEMLVKVKDACIEPFNRYWVFFAATTNVEFTLTVTDTSTGQQWEYHNPQGTPAPPIQDVDAFATCP